MQEMEHEEADRVGKYFAIDDSLSSTKIQDMASTAVLHRIFTGLETKPNGEWRISTRCQLFLPLQSQRWPYSTHRSALGAEIALITASLLIRKPVDISSAHTDISSPLGAPHQLNHTKGSCSQT